MLASRYIAAIVAAAALCFATPAGAQNSEIARAKKHFKAAEAHYQAKRYADAAAEYTEAYELSKAIPLLYSIAQSYRLAGDSVRAVDYYDRYVAQGKDPQLLEAAREFAKELRATINKPPPDDPKETPDPVDPNEFSGTANKTNDPPPNVRPDPVRTEPVGTNAGVAPPPDDFYRPPESGAGRGLRITGIVTVAAGVAALAVGAKFGLDAKDISDEISAHETGPWPDELLDKQSEGESAETKMIVFTIVGGVAVITGSVLYGVGHARGKRELHVAPSVGSDGSTAMVLFGRF